MSADAPIDALAYSLLRAPAGVALLAMLEGVHRRDGAWFGGPKGSRPEAVAKAVAATDEITFGGLIALALEGARQIAGPWMSNAPADLAEAYRCADDRAPIADAVATRFGPALRSDLDPAGQEWWNTPWPPGRSAEALFRDFSDVYGSGEFPWDGLWTVTAPPPATHEELIAAWEFDHGSVSRWCLPARPEARVFEIHHPGDWAALVARYPQPALRRHEGWELPGPNQAASEVSPLIDGGFRNAARSEVGTHLVPDWHAVAGDFDGVHLSWAGFLTTEGFISDLSDDAVTMLRYWSGERTLWLADAFLEPLPLAAPTLSGGYCNVTGADVRTDSSRRQSDLADLTVSLGRA